MGPFDIKAKKEKEQKRKRRNIIIFSLVGSIVVLGGAGAGLYFVLKPKNNDGRKDLASIFGPSGKIKSVPVPTDSNSGSDDEFKAIFMKAARASFSDGTEVDLTVSNAETDKSSDIKFEGTCTITITAKPTSQKYKGEATAIINPTTMNS